MLNENKETIVLDQIIGEETHKCFPEVILVLGGRVGDIIKEFKLEKKGKSEVKVSKILELSEFVDE